MRRAGGARAAKRLCARATKEQGRSLNARASVVVVRRRWSSLEK
jgi:hypothetical protein